MTCNLGAEVAARSALNIPLQADLSELPPNAQKLVLLAFGIGSLSTCLIIFIGLWLRYRITLRELGWDSQYLVRDIVLGMKAFAMLAPVVYAVQFVLTQFVESKHPIIEMLRKSPDTGYFVAAAFAAVIAAPIVEEFLFRVLLLGWLERICANRGESAVNFFVGGREPTQEFSEIFDAQIVEKPGEPYTPPQANPYIPPITSPFAADFVPQSPATKPRWTPIVISSVLFALMHGTHGPDPIPLFLLALGLGYLYQRTGRIVASVTVHFLLNLCSLIALRLAV
jgi:membrane protease YdiL (CAAX protease family)